MKRRHSERERERERDKHFDRSEVKNPVDQYLCVDDRSMNHLIEDKDEEKNETKVSWFRSLFRFRRLA